MNPKTITRVFLITIVFACLAVGSFRTVFASSETTLTGTVSCSTCSGIHMRPRNPGLTCTVWCISQGAKYTFIVGDKRFMLVGSRNLLEKVAGGKATLNGHIEGDTFELASIEPTKHAK